MSRRPISRSPDLRRLRDDGYELDVRDGYLLVGHVPFVTADRTVAYGTLVSSLALNGEITAPPDGHEVWFVGGRPCDQHGSELTGVINQPGPILLAGGLEAACSFSSKPSGGYTDYHHKMSIYAGLLEGHARAIDPSVTAQTHRPMAPAEDDDAPFRYLDTATSRADIGVYSERLSVAKAVIVGLGGTGSYILDLLTKAPIREIHLYDGDLLLNHNAFRMAGAASIDDLQARLEKVAYLQGRYDPMHRGVVPHACHLTEANVVEITDASIVFLAIDDGAAKRPIIAALERQEIPFIDVGMGLYKSDAGLGGQVRTTTSAPGHRDHVHAGRISFADPAEDLYGSNIQIADLNMLNASLAVIRWKKMVGFYADLEGEHDSIYEIDGNSLVNGEGRHAD